MSFRVASVSAGAAFVLIFVERHSIEWVKEWNSENDAEGEVFSRGWIAWGDLQAPPCWDGNSSSSSLPVPATAALSLKFEGYALQSENGTPEKTSRPNGRAVTARANEWAKWAATGGGSRREEKLRNSDKYSHQHRYESGRRWEHGVPFPFRSATFPDNREQNGDGQGCERKKSEWVSSLSSGKWFSGTVNEASLATDYQRIGDRLRGKGLPSTFDTTG